MADYIYTVSKQKFYPTNPKKDDIIIEDVAHALSMLARANGHFPFFHSVAQHSIECAIESEKRGYSAKITLACLLHDASEAYMSDVTTPVKNNLSDYSDFENRLIDLIYEKYIGPLTKEEKDVVYRIDKDLLYHEFKYYMGIELGNETILLSNPEFKFEEFSMVRDKYLKMFYDLISKL
ncbi:MAG: phosphohydrolase [Ruminococcaceae bacterium]|nr:phosphohydrolase [Oscillospiraceae bacterium]